MNFRLELSRLHADWLIEQKSKSILAIPFVLLAADTSFRIRGSTHVGSTQDGQCDPEINPFPGFEEGPINFPCTFKYDVCYISFSVISMIIMSAHHLCIYNRYGNPSAQLTARSGGTSNAANPPPLLHQLTLILLKSPLPTLVMVVAVVVKQVGTRSL